MKATALERLDLWAARVEATVELACRPNRYANFLPQWSGEARWSGSMDIVAEAGPCETAEACAQTLIDRLQLGGVSVP